MLHGIATCEMPEPGMRSTRAEVIRSDCALPEDVVPVGQASARPRVVLLTGATGFVGRYVLRELLERQDAEVLCLVRADDDAAADRRLEKILAGIGMLSCARKGRVRSVRGDVTQPRFGLKPGAYGKLSRRVEAVHHCAAEVSWVRSYKQLRRINVGGTLELLRFACHLRPKAFLFVSTLAVCFARGGPVAVDERTDMSPWLDRMPLGYAQSKCVSESLLRAAAGRGLPVTIVRAGLVCGDTANGIGNPGDLIGALIEGCVKQGEAIDADWLFDSVPVDYAARAIVALGQRRNTALDVYHLRHGRPRHWREMILWLNLVGYPVRFAPTASWIHSMFADRAAGIGSLYGYRRFFAGLPGVGEGERPFEAYLAPAQASVSCEYTRNALAVLGIAEPVINGDLLRRYLDHYAATGVVPRQVRMASWAGRKSDATLRATVQKSLQLQHAAPDLRLVHWQEVPFDGGSSILSDIASIRLGAGVGMRRYRAGYARPRADRGSMIDMVVKDKAQDVVMHGLITEVATLCDRELGRNFGRFESALGLRRCHLRELELYRSPQPGFAHHMPRCYGVTTDEGRGVWSVAIEHLANAELIGAAEACDQWAPAHIEAAIRGAARMHAAWYGRQAELRSASWMAPEITAHDAVAMSPLWHSLARFSDSFFGPWSGGSLLALQSKFIGRIGQWWNELATMPGTLIHNDYNPRNLGFRREAGGSKVVCAFDWELARIGIPQHDLAELLCFVLPGNAGADQLSHWLDFHRTELESCAGVTVDPAAWTRGFVLALRQLAIDRIPYYALAHRFKPQAFLPGVVRNWLKLYELSLDLGSADSRRVYLPTGLHGPR